MSDTEFFVAICRRCGAPKRCSERWWCAACMVPVSHLQGRRGGCLSMVQVVRLGEAEGRPVVGGAVGGERLSVDDGAPAWWQRMTWAMGHEGQKNDDARRTEEARQRRTARRTERRRQRRNAA